MNVNHKIFRLMLIALLCCFCYIESSRAQQIPEIIDWSQPQLPKMMNEDMHKKGISVTTTNQNGDTVITTYGKNKNGQNTTSQHTSKKNITIPYKADTYTIDNKEVDEKTYEDHVAKSAPFSGEGMAAKANNLSNKEISTPSNTVVSPQQISACTSDYGMFSGLITAGGKIFRGLRELIYVVAGFGIIGVAVGGFFGTLNYKWLGAIVISLVIIATTGELINAITGCENFTAQVITDTLKR